MSQLADSSIGLKVAFCSSVLSLEGKDQIGSRKEQSTHCRKVARSSASPPIDAKHIDA